MTTQKHSGTWSVIEVDEFHTVVNVFGSFQTEEEARKYARRAFYLGRDEWERKPVHHNSFDVAPWHVANPDFR
jgi:hypothetical protein